MINNICSENAKQLNYILNNASQSTLSSIPRESLQNVVVVVECSKIFNLFQCKKICSIKCLAEPKIFLNLLWNYYEVCGRYCLYRGIHSRPVYHQNIAYQSYLQGVQKKMWFKPILGFLTLGGVFIGVENNSKNFENKKNIRLFSKILSKWTLFIRKMQKFWCFYELF